MLAKVWYMLGTEAGTRLYRLTETQDGKSVYEIWSKGKKDWTLSDTAYGVFAGFDYCMSITEEQANKYIRDYKNSNP
ncbi:MAG: hypothetical protein GX802_01780 [Clostridiales bacterium]|jgi:hypothetical protein|nr:hypothetical protein [Clostridiales bacterium]